MVFSSLTFLFGFLPLFLACYFLVKEKYRNLVLFLFSLLFYSWGEPKYVLIMLFSTCWDFMCGEMVDRYRGTTKAKTYLLASVIVNLGMLVFFKYSNFLIKTVNGLIKTDLALLNITLPVGISFYTFQTMSYTIDVYRGDARPQEDIISFGAYVTLFPQLVAGPIVRYQTIAEQLNDRKTDWNSFADGIKRFSLGLSKKVLLANNVGLIWENISSNLSSMTVISSWLGITAFALQIYFDFSGYSDMAIGLGKMLGFQFPENFNYPYISVSITQFWRRWHMSLGQWFRDYVYIPLGGNRKGMSRQLINISIVWLLTGFWHGASWNFLLWGCYFGIILILEKVFLLKWLEKLPKPFRHMYALLCILTGWVIFSFENPGSIVTYLKTMFGFSRPLVDSSTIFLLMNNIVLLTFGVVCATPLLSKIYSMLKERRNIFMAEMIFVCAAIVLSVIYIVSGSYNPFMYFRF